MQNTQVTNQIPTACFAPPLTDGMIARYEELASNATGPIRGIMQTCLKAVKKWWDLPASVRSDGDRFVTMRGGKQVTYQVMPLEVEHMDDASESGELWDDVPYDYELDAMHQIAVTVQAEAAKRNGDKRDAWKIAVRQATIGNSFTEEEVTWLFSPERRMVRDMINTMAHHECASVEILDRVLNAVWPGMNRATLHTQGRRMKELEAKLPDMYDGRAESPIPAPMLEPTELRDAAMHLIWMCKELCLNREPLTQEILNPENSVVRVN